ncbi:MAG TPA: autotransporter outer membrane beta-barrel domain-containing protein, partial [Rhizomicrobium sp.]|nr:autotransporter outer membrane beta-barrel domain-containing protein [Rhizomicrobium sp.]
GAYGRYDTSTARVVDVAGLVAAENAQYGVNQGQAFGRIGIPIAMDDTAIEPFVSGSYTDASIDKFTESTGPVALENGGQTIDRTQSVAGFRSSVVFRDGDAIFTPNLTLGWVHNFDSTAPGVRLGFAGMDSNSFLVDGVATNTEAGLVQAGLDASIGSGISLGIGYEGQFGDREQDQGVHVNIKANY